MNDSTQCNIEGLTLTGLDGSNPLAFLAALGVLRTLSLAWPGQEVNMYWAQCSGAWRPVVRTTEPPSPPMTAAAIAKHLRCGFEPNSAAKLDCEKIRKGYEKIKTQIKKKREDINKRSISPEERKHALMTELEPLEEEERKSRAEWLEMLSSVVPFPELRLGKHLDSTCHEFRGAAVDILQCSSLRGREQLDMLAAFASDGCFDEKSKRIQATPFCFATGSGHQFFLDTARQLVSRVTQERIYAALFEPWIHVDETLSMRWDPVEDRRYALMSMDPTDSKNKATTNWAANLVAYRGLQLLPSFPTQSGLKTAAFPLRQYFVWPIWEGPLSVEVVRSILLLPALAAQEIDLAAIRALGLKAVYRAERIIVGNPPLHKVNFSPATALF